MKCQHSLWPGPSATVVKVRAGDQSSPYPQVRCRCGARGSERLTDEEAIGVWNRASKIVNDTKALCEAHGVPWDA